VSKDQGAVTLKDGQHFYVFDLDGTLADCRRRMGLLDGTDQGYRRFFAAVGDDRPILHVISLLNLLNSTGHLVEIWSGRSDECRDLTKIWLSHNGMAPRRLTRMRRAGDKRPDDMVKREMLRESVWHGKTPTIVFDDRDRVVQMWRSEGIPCFQVAEGAF
jgi:hypothetical protein